MRKPKKIGLLTAGGDCPGLNAALHGVEKTAILKYGMEVVGISSGFPGLLHKVGDKLRLIPKNNPLLEKVRWLGVCFGNKNFFLKSEYAMHFPD